MRNAICETRWMETLDSVGARLKWAREQDGRFSTGSDAARAFGWAVSTYLGHENGDRNPSRDSAKRYAAAYKVPWAWILEGGPTPDQTKGSLPEATPDSQSAGSAPSEEADPPLDPSTLPTSRMTREPPPQGVADVPVWAAVQAGDDGALLLTAEPIDYIRRSERMLGVRNPFAFYVIGLSMSPAIEHGDQIVVNPTIPVRPGADCVFIHEQADGTMLALVKRLLRNSPEHWRVRQFNPLKDYDLPKKRWSRALVVPEIRRGGL